MNGVKALNMRFPNRSALFSVCRQIRKESQSAFCHRTPFVIAASLYQYNVQDSRSQDLRPMAQSAIPQPFLARISRLVLITSLRPDSDRQLGYRMSDLRYLQAMTSLRHLTLVLTNPQIAASETFKSGNEAATPIYAVMESIPTDAVVSFGPKDENEATRLDAYENGGSLVYRRTEHINVDPSAIEKGYANLELQSEKLIGRKGLLSGSPINHELCAFQSCVEDKACANSRLNTAPPQVPQALPSRAGRFYDKLGRRLSGKVV